ncbi:Imm1 family immunity protein [Nocardia sp. NPDC051981]|uniref:Imm1 family immunity protein n=1 Tax=Nocardia sp. NPDC051981 TaxID=3155417 RepID=UPI00342341CC
METVGTITFDAGYLPRHVDDPILPSSGEELAAVVDEMNSSPNEDCDYLSIAVIDSEGSHVAQMGVGVRAGDSLGCLYYIGSEGDFYSKGTRAADEPVAYYDFGNERLFAPGSQIPLNAVKHALIQLFDSGGARPSSVEWQEWHSWIVDLDDDDEAKEQYSVPQAHAPGPDYSDPPF